MLLNIFFESYREQKLLTFYIHNGGDNITIEHLNVIKKYLYEGIIEYSNHLCKINNRLNIFQLLYIISFIKKKNCN
jgi:hypothetical protein